MFLCSLGMAKSCPDPAPQPSREWQFVLQFVSLRQAVVRHNIPSHGHELRSKQHPQEDHCQKPPQERSTVLLAKRVRRLPAFSVPPRSARSVRGDPFGAIRSARSVRRLRSHAVGASRRVRSHTECTEYLRLSDHAAQRVLANRRDFASRLPRVCVDRRGRASCSVSEAV